MVAILIADWATFSVLRTSWRRPRSGFAGLMALIVPNMPLLRTA
jgi:hypothetical protein